MQSLHKMPINLKHKIRFGNCIKFLLALMLLVSTTMSAYAADTVNNQVNSFTYTDHNRGHVLGLGYAFMYESDENQEVLLQNAPYTNAPYTLDEQVKQQELVNIIHSQFYVHTDIGFSHSKSTPINNRLRDNSDNFDSIDIPTISTSVAVQNLLIDNLHLGMEYHYNLNADEKTTRYSSALSDIPLYDIVTQQYKVNNEFKPTHLPDFTHQISSFAQYDLSTHWQFGLMWTIQDKPNTKPTSNSASSLPFSSLWQFSVSYKM